MLKTKSIHSPIEPAADGLRVLVARLRGRGVSKDRYDVWMANLGPSQTLLQDFLREKVAWGEFSRRYRAEMREDSPLDCRNPLIKNHGQKFTLRLLKTLAARGNVTLLCHCAEGETHCHRHLLKRLIASA